MLPFSWRRGDTEAPPSKILEAQEKLVGLVGSVLQMETQLEVKGKNDKELYEDRKSVV